MWKHVISFCCNPKYYKSHSGVISHKKQFVNHNNEKFFVQLIAINEDFNNVLIRNKTFNQINAISNDGLSVTNQKSNQISEPEGANNILTEGQTFIQVNSPSDKSDNANQVSTQENLSNGMYTHCPNCQEELTVGFQCKVCENYYYGNCQICNRERTGEFWCQHCESLAYKKEFEKWTSGDKNIDALIQRAQINAIGNWQVWEWIPYTQFTGTEIKHLGEGGFGTVYLATWLDGPRDNINRDTQRVERRPNEKVILKVLHNSQSIDAAFLREVESNYVCRFASVGWVLGITQKPTTNEYTIVMRYYEKGDLRNFLKDVKSLTWKDKLNVLRNVSFALTEIHKEGLLHRDLHPGNIYQRYNSRYNIYVSYLGDLGLCTPANESPTLSKVYGVLPYVAPEVLLKKKPYTSKSEIYSFGIIMSEIASGKPPFPNEPHDKELAFKIYAGARPEYPNKIPKCYVDLMKKCWDEDPLKRPTSEMVYDKINEWYNDYESGEEISNVFKEADEVQNNEMVQETSEAQSSPDIHPEAVYSSRLLSNFIIE